MAYAKCQYCKKPLSTKNAFKVVVNNKNKYWCDENCYEHTTLERTKPKKNKPKKPKTASTVICQICRKKIIKDIAYKITTTNPKSGKQINKYYCSQQEWQAEENRKNKAREDKDKVYYFICDMFGYEIQNTWLFDEWSRWNKLKSNEIIYKYLEENEAYLRSVCNRLYDNEYQKIRYFSAVLKNSLRDFTPKVIKVEQPRVAIEEHYETKYKSKSRQALEDFEEDCDE